MASHDDRHFFNSVRAMVGEMEIAVALVRPSAYWQFLNEMNAGQLERYGYSAFKRTVNGNYFQWLPRGPRDPQFRAVLREWFLHPTWSAVDARLEERTPFLDARVKRPFRSPLAKAGYAFFLAGLWEYCMRCCPKDLADTLEEPATGNPLGVVYRGRRVSQDMCNSLLEFTAITKALPDGALPGSGVLELGGGYGRLAWMFLREVPQLRYFMVDIPPALALAQRYLTELFPDLPAFRFRRFHDFDDVREEFYRARIGFLTPNQLELIPPFQARLVVNISSLHEMRFDQIDHYIAQIANHCSGYFYTKQPIRSENPYDGLVVHRSDYPTPPAWEVVFDRRHPIQTHFFEALYRVRSEAAAPG
ncbi:MAG: putative sugar O-methyltransferase [Actinomycetota bacterium]|nr:putative sugar O-methyltransferase [Actinomycetota bacterium]